MTHTSTLCLGATLLFGALAVQRLNTVGGQPLGFGCSSATLGRQVQMAYRADYVFYVPRVAALRLGDVAKWVR